MGPNDFKAKVQLTADDLLLQAKGNSEPASCTIWKYTPWHGITTVDHSWCVAVDGIAGSALYILKWCKCRIANELDAAPEPKSPKSSFFDVSFDTKTLAPSSSSGSGGGSLLSLHERKPISCRSFGVERINWVWYDRMISVVGWQ